MTRRHDRRSACAFDEASEKASNVIACRLMPGISRDVESRRCVPVLHMCLALNTHSRFSTALLSGGNGVRLKGEAENACWFSRALHRAVD